MLYIVEAYNGIDLLGYLIYKDNTLAHNYLIVNESDARKIIEMLRKGNLLPL